MKMNPKTLLISIIIHIFVLISTLYIWDNYVRTPDKQTNTKKEVTPDKQESKEIIPEQKNIQKEILKPISDKNETKKTQKVIQKPITEEKTKPIIKKTTTELKEKQKIKKVVKKQNLEPKDMGDFLVEEVPHELIYIGRNRPSKTTLKDTEKIKQRAKEQKLKQQRAKEQKLKQQRAKEQKLKQQRAKEQKLKQQKSHPNTYMKTNEKIISKLLKKHLYYPNSIRKKGITGIVMVRFKLNKNKRIYDITVIKSDNKQLSRAAMKTISDLSGKLPKPNKDMLLYIPVEYKLSKNN